MSEAATCGDCRHGHRDEDGRLLCAMTGNVVGASRPACEDFSRLIYYWPLKPAVADSPRTTRQILETERRIKWFLIGSEKIAPVGDVPPTKQPQPRRDSAGILGYKCECCGSNALKEELAICEFCERQFCFACKSGQPNVCRNCGNEATE